MGPRGRPRTDVEAARDLIDRYEESVDDTSRRARGIHYTPHDLARMLARRSIDLVQQRLGHLPRTICDPSCGGGSFLLAVAQELHERGVDPMDVVTNRLIGYDIDDRAVEVTRRALAMWATSGGAVDDDDGSDPVQLVPRVGRRDVLDPSGGSDLGRHDLVIGNPPFLSQLRTATASGPAVLAALSSELGPLDPYVDISAVFLAIAVRSLTEGGVACLIQPQSFLSNAGAASIRARVVGCGGPLELWSAPTMMFAAKVRVCAVTTGSDGTVGRGDGTCPPGTTLVVWSGDRESAEPTQQYRVDRPEPSETWGPMIAPALGIPVIADRGTDRGTGGRRAVAYGPVDGPDTPPGMSIGEIARCTAGFRDEYYAVRDACREEETGDRYVAVPDGTGSSRTEPLRIVTTGLIRPGGCEWGATPARIGGSDWIRPVLAPDALEDIEPRVRSWIAARSVPKVLVATQSRIVEACADPDGSLIPLTPVISVEPLPGWQDMVVPGQPERARRVDIWWLVAALSAPSISVGVLTANLGSGLSLRSFRWSAKAVGAVRLPLYVDEWEAGAEAAARLASAGFDDRVEHLEVLGRHMLAAHGMADDVDVLDWWMERAIRA